MLSLGGTVEGELHGVMENLGGLGVTEVSRDAGHRDCLKSHCRLQTVTGPEHRDWLAEGEGPVLLGTFVSLAPGTVPGIDFLLMSPENAGWWSSCIVKHVV